MSRGRTQSEARAISKPTIFTISAAWDAEAAVWSGHCDDIPAAADAPTLDGLMLRIREAIEVSLDDTVASDAMPLQ